MNMDIGPGEKVPTERDILNWKWPAGLAVFSAAVSFMVFLLPPIILFDSLKYINAANYFVSNGWDVDMLPVEVGPLYPFLITTFRFAADGVASLLWVDIVQFFCSIGLDLLAAYLVYLITRRASVALFTGFFSALMLEKTFVAAAVMTETTFTFAVMVFLALFALAVTRASLPAYLLSLVILGLSSGLRETAATFWFIPGLVFAAVFVYRQILACGDGETSRRWRRVLAAAVAALCILALSSVIVSAVGIPFRKAGLGSTHKMAVLWYQLLQNGPKNIRAEFANAHPDYIADYESMKARRQHPPAPRLDPIWQFVEPWPYLLAHGKDWSWWKMPPWVLQTSRGYTYQESLAWQGEIALDILRRHWPVYIMDLYLPDIYYSMVVPVGVLMFTEGDMGQQVFKKGGLLGTRRLRPDTPPSLFQRSFVKPFNRVMNFLGITRLLFVFRLLIVLGAFVGLLLHPRPLNVALVLFITAISAVNIAFGGVQARYIILFFPFAGFFLFNWFELWRRMIRPRLHPAR